MALEIEEVLRLNRMLSEATFTVIIQLLHECCQ